MSGHTAFSQRPLQIPPDTPTHCKVDESAKARRPVEEGSRYRRTPADEIVAHHDVTTRYSVVAAHCWFSTTPTTSGIRGPDQGARRSPFCGSTASCITTRTLLVSQVRTSLLSCAWARGMHANVLFARRSYSWMCCRSAQPGCNSGSEAGGPAIRSRWGPHQPCCQHPPDYMGTAGHHRVAESVCTV
jgi:hypothetical protein